MAGNDIPEYKVKREDITVTLGIVKSIRMKYNDTGEFCDNSQKLSVESGKSYLLFNLFKDYLLAEGTGEQHIIEIAFDSFENKRFRDPYEKFGCMDNSIHRTWKS